MEFDGGILLREYERAGCDEDSALITGLATAGVCTMHAAAAQQQGDLISRSEEQLRNPGFRSKYPIALSTACRMYGVPMPTEAGGYRLHTALYDAEMAGRLYFAMRGLRYREAPIRVVRRLKK